MSETTARPLPDSVLLLAFGGPTEPAHILPYLKIVTCGRGIPDERLKVVLNRVSKENQLQVNDIQKAFAHPITATIPNDGRLVPSSINRGVPFMMTHPQTPVGLGIKDFMGLLLGRPTETDSAAQPAAKPGFLSRFSWQTALKAAP